MRKALLLALTITVAACGGGEVEQPGDTAPTTPTVPSHTSSPAPDDTTTTTGQRGGSLPEADQAVVDRAIADLAEHLQVPASAITLVSFERVTWNDGSLGCPQPGMAYTQALVDGSRTVLEAEGVSYSYHAGQDDDPFLCEDPALRPAPDRR